MDAVLLEAIAIAPATQLQPELFGQVGGEGCQQDQQAAQGLGREGIAGSLQVACHGIAQLHQLRHGGVELVVAIEVVADLGDRRMHGPAQLPFGSVQARARSSTG